MLISTNQTSNVTQVVFSEHSNAPDFNGGFTVRVTAAGIGREVIPQMSTINSRSVIIGFTTTFNATVYIDKFSAVGITSRENVGIFAPGTHLIASVSLLETCRLYVSNGDLVDGDFTATMIARP